jgi:hypothetical protein
MSMSAPVSRAHALGSDGIVNFPMNRNLMGCLANSKLIAGAEDAL